MREFHIQASNVTLPTCQKPLWRGRGRRLVWPEVLDEIFPHGVMFRLPARQLGPLQAARVVAVTGHLPRAPVLQQSRQDNYLYPVTDGALQEHVIPPGARRKDPGEIITNLLVRALSRSSRRSCPSRRRGRLRHGRGTRRRRHDGGWAGSWGLPAFWTARPHQDPGGEPYSQKPPTPHSTPPFSLILFFRFFLLRHPWSWPRCLPFHPLNGDLHTLFGFTDSTSPRISFGALQYHHSLVSRSCQYPVLCQLKGIIQPSLQAFSFAGADRQRGVLPGDGGSRLVSIQNLPGMLSHSCPGPHGCSPLPERQTFCPPSFSRQPP